MTNCKNCGAPIKNGHCSYCGADYNEQIPQMFIRVDRRPVEVIKAQANLDMNFMHSVGLEEASAIAVREIANKLAEGIIPFMEIETEYRPQFMTRTFTGKIRIVPPGREL